MTHRLTASEAMAEIAAASAGGRRADLRWVDLRGVDLRGANLSGANLRGVDLRGADLSRADLSRANLRGANLRRADLRWVDLRGVLGGLLTIDGLHPYRAVLAPTPDGWHLTIGCWSGTIDQLETLAAHDDGWPEAGGDEIARRRPLLHAIVAMARAHAEYHHADLAAVAEKWGADQ